MGRVVSTQAPGKPAATVSYSNGDQTASPVVPASQTVTRPEGVSVTTTFDVDREPAGVAYSDGTHGVTNTFDADGRLTSSVGAVTTARSYDTLGEVLSVTRAGRSVVDSYARPGKVVSVKYPNNKTVTRSYDASGRWSGVTDWGNASTTFSYDADGNVTNVAMSNGISMSRDFDADGQIAKVIYGFPSGAWPITYTRGTAGELTGASQLGGTNTWAYDPAQQITATTNPTGAYSFDQAGNPTMVNGNTQTFDGSGELCWVGTGTGTCGSPPSGATIYSYDNKRQRTTAGADTFGYDGTGQMTSATTPAGTVSYTYGTDGLRTSKTVGSTTTVFAWDDLNAAVPELIQDGDDYYLYGPDGLPFERLGSDPTQWLFTDATGSVAASTDATATITGQQGYDAWGNVTGHTGTPVSLGWHSQYQDPETHYYYLWHRYYDPATAQLTTPDPLYALTGSRYGYAYNDPVNGSDPTGLCGFLGSGACSFSGIKDDVGSRVNSGISHATAGRANCVRYVTCAGSTQSVADTHPVLRDTLYVVAGAAATVASGGLALDGLAAFEAGEGLTTAAYLEGGAATAIGIGVAAGDHGRCSAGDEVACVAMWSGLSAAALGGLGLLPGEAGLMLAWLGLFPGGVGLALDGIALGDEAFNALGCH